MAIVAVCGDDATPHKTILAHLSGSRLLQSFRPVDVRDALSQIEFCIVSVLDAFDLNARLAAMLVATVTLVTKMNALYVQSNLWNL